jgi:hypothetical protein
MAKTTIYKDIPVFLTTETEQLFDFEVGESGQVGQNIFSRARTNYR